MALVRSSNLERSKWRSKCREELSKHIQHIVGLLIEPSQVRLITRSDDPYTWKVLPEKKHLFSKNISDHSIGAYKELCEGINVAFEAIPTSISSRIGSKGCVQETITSLEPTQMSFSSKIDELHVQNVALKRELRHWEDQAVAESELRQQFEQELKELKVANQELGRDFQKSVKVINCFRSDTNKYIHILNGVMPLMDELRAELTSSEGSGDLCPVEGDPISYCG